MTLREVIKNVAKLIRTQNNRATDSPIFIVQEKVRDWGYDSDYADDYAWVNINEDHREADEEEAALLDKYVSSRYDPWQKTYYKERWKFVTACFTEQGCKDFIQTDGHNHGELRIYAASSHRNGEYRAVRNFLMAAEREGAI